MVNHNLKVAIQAVMGACIVVLGYLLYHSITDPWEAIERQQELTDMTRDRMAQVRTALIRYERMEDRYPGSLDSLMMWVRADSVITSNPDSVFETVDINLDSLLYSPRTGNAFVYALNDTGRVAIYLLQDPDSDDQIGSAEPVITLINAASWE